MRKAVKGTLALAMVAMLGVGMAGCGKVSRLVPDKEGEHTFSINRFTSLHGEEDYMLLGTSGTYMVVKSQEYDYQVIDVKEDRILYTSEQPISILDNGLFISYDAEDKIYTLYANGMAHTYSDASVDGTVFTNASSGVRIYVDVNGQIQTESNPFERLLTYGDNAKKVGNKYVKMDGMTISVFDKNGTYETTRNAQSALGIAEDEEISTYWWVDDTIFIQTRRMLPQDAEDYDYIVDGSKVDIATYSYNVRRDSTRELRHFDYVVNRSVYDTSKAVVLSVQKIEDEKLEATSIVQSFNESGYVYVDLQAQVPGATSFSENNGVVTIGDVTGYKHIFKDGKKLISLSEAQAFELSFVGTSAYKMAGETLMIYDLENNAELTKITGVKQVAGYQNKIIYEQKESSIHKICSYDTTTRLTEEESLKKSQTVAIMGDYVTISEDGEMKKVIFLSAGNMEKKDNVISVQTFASLSQRDTGVTYTILKFIDDEDTVIYQLVERAEPIEKK